jgi:hypothetical protein
MKTKTILIVLLHFHAMYNLYAQVSETEISSQRLTFITQQYIKHGENYFFLDSSGPSYDWNKILYQYKGLQVVFEPLKLSEVEKLNGNLYKAYIHVKAIAERSMEYTKNNNLNSNNLHWTEWKEFSNITRTIYKKRKNWILPYFRKNSDKISHSDIELALKKPIPD